ncbi:eukaryotic translation initiation factor 3subunit M [Striga asiatica]|uniref:Eukaryotic translation initiation factor 3subunit M n=1 Tax=Striga asiatica TaxID=4170 RepID=A0A5A7QJ91_STRAF|nr:eukaryotic translation initiation factor 3subunit M [Striga asiatica]
MNFMCTKSTSSHPDPPLSSPTKFHAPPAITSSFCNFSHRLPPNVADTVPDSADAADLVPVSAQCRRPRWRDFPSLPRVIFALIEGQPKPLLPVDIPGLDARPEIPIKRLNQSCDRQVDRAVGQREPNADPPARPERDQLKVLPLVLDVGSEEPLGPELERVGPDLRVTPYGPRVDEHLGALRDVVAHIVGGFLRGQHWVEAEGLLNDRLQVRHILDVFLLNPPVNAHDPTHRDDDIDILLRHPIWPILSIPLVLEQHVKEILLLPNLPCLALIQPLLYKPRRNPHRNLQIPLHLPLHPGRVHPLEPRQIIGYIRRPSQLEHPVHAVKELPRLRVLGIQQVPRQHQVPDEIEGHQEEEPAELDGPRASLGPVSGRLLDDPSLHVVADAVSEVGGLVHALVDEELHGAEAAEDAPVAAELVHAEGAGVEVVGGEDVGDLAVGEGEVVLLEELGGSGRALDDHGVDGAELEPDDGAVGRAPAVHGGVGEVAQLVEITEDGDALGAGGCLARGFWPEEGYGEEEEAG